jgi:predicted GTPase
VINETTKPKPPPQIPQKIIEKNLKIKNDAPISPQGPGIHPYKATQEEIKIPEPPKGLQKFQVRPSDLDKVKLPIPPMKLAAPSAEIAFGDFQYEVIQPEHPKKLRIGLLGLPNAGKSSLLNYLMEEKVSIVSGRPQTTREEILGIYSTENIQLVSKMKSKTLLDIY